MDQILEGQAKKCQKSLQKLQKHITSIGGAEKCPTVHSMVIDIIEALENGASVNELHDLCDKLINELNDNNDIELKQHAEVFASNVKKLKQKADYQEFLQIMTLDQTAEDSLFWTRQEDEPEFDAEAEWKKATNIYYNGGDIYEAIMTFEAFAKIGYNAACFFLGVIYEEGRGVPKDLAKAVSYYKQGAVDNEKFKADEDCQIRLYHCYANGEGVAKNIQTALSWLQKAVDKEYPNALHLMASYYIFENPSQGRRGFELAKKAVDKGYKNSNLLLSYAYAYGIGVTQSLSSAEQYLRVAEQEGVENCQAMRDIINDIRRGNGSQQTTTSSGTPTPEKPKDDDDGSGWGCLIIAALIGAGWWFGWWSSAWNWVSGLFEGSGDPMYVLADKANIREDDSDRADIVGSVIYGNEVRVYKHEGSWYKAKADGERGYIAASCLCTPTEMEQLNSVWGDPKAADDIKELRNRRALIHFRQNVVTDTSCKLYGNDYDGKNYYVNKALGTNGAFAFIVDNQETSERLAVLYLFDSKDTPQLENTDDTVRPGQYIKAVKQNKKGVYYFVYGGKPIKVKKNKNTSNSEQQSSQQQQKAQQETKPASTEEKPKPQKVQKAQEPEPEPEPTGSTGFSLKRVDKIPE